MGQNPAGRDVKETVTLIMQTKTYGHTEELAYKWLEVNPKRAPDVTIKKSTIDEIHTDHTEADFFCAKILADTGEKKPLKMNVLVDGYSDENDEQILKNAEVNVKESTRDFLADIEVLKIEKTSIIEIVPHDYGALKVDFETIGHDPSSDLNND